MCSTVTDAILTCWFFFSPFQWFSISQDAHPPIYFTEIKSAEKWYVDMLLRKKLTTPPKNEPFRQSFWFWFLKICFDNLKYRYAWKAQNFHFLCLGHPCKCSSKTCRAHKAQGNHCAWRSMSYFSYYILTWMWSVRLK